MDLQFFDPKAEYGVVWKRLPHWAQAGVVCFMTWRTWDSMPRAVLAAWLAERDDWLSRHGIDPRAVDWRSRVEKLDVRSQEAFRGFVADRWDRRLDECHGKCVLRERETATIVADSFYRFDGDRYELVDFVVMPNHIHLLAALPTEEGMLKQCYSWKKYTATHINRRLGRRGEFWQTEGFDHLLRSNEELAHYRSYIAENPIRAHLSKGQYLLHRRAL
jgi:putative transposase